jgi:hypothetical protein
MDIFGLLVLQTSLLLGGKTAFNQRSRQALESANPLPGVVARPEPMDGDHRLVADHPGVVTTRQ